MLPLLHRAADAVEGRRQLALADPKQLFRALHATAVEFDCAPLFLSTLQHMILVPSYDELGKHMWQQIEASVHAVVLPAEEHKEYALTLANLRKGLGWKERVEELSAEAAAASRSAEIARETVARLEAALEALPAAYPLMPLRAEASAQST